MGEGAESFALIDQTLARGQQCLWGGRMTAEMMLAFLKRMDGFGFAAIDIMTPALFEACVLKLKENPFGRIRRAAERAEETPLNVWTRGRFLFADAPVEPRLVAKGIALLAEAGVRSLTSYDPLNDVASLAGTVAAADAAGLAVTGALVYGPAPGRTVSDYVALARALRDLDVAAVCLFDPAGLLDPDAARALIPALLDAVGPVPVSLMTHCRSGRAEIVCLEAVAEGVGTLNVAAPPLAGGLSLPSGAYVIEKLRRDGIECPTSRAQLAEMADYFGALGEAEGWPAAAHQLSDQTAPGHQMPVSQMAWLAACGAEVDGPALLSEIAAIREDLGHPPMSVPVARCVARQAMENVSAKARYERCHAGFAALVRGRLGALPGPIDVALGRGMAGSANDDRGDQRAGREDCSDDEAVIAACCGAEALDGLGTGPGPSEVPDVASPRDLLDMALAHHPSLRRLRIEKDAFSYDWHAGARA